MAETNIYVAKSNPDFRGFSKIKAQFKFGDMGSLTALLDSMQLSENFEVFVFIPARKGV